MYTPFEMQIIKENENKVKRKTPLKVPRVYSGGQKLKTKREFWCFFYYVIILN